MKNQLLLLSLVLLYVLSACHKDPAPVPLRCADVVIDTSRLTPAWTFKENYFASIYPAVFGQQVVFSRYASESESELLGFDGTSGQLLWQSIIPAGYLGDRRYRQLDSKLYFKGEPQNLLLSFDVVTQQIETVWALPTSGHLSTEFAIQPGFVICPVFQAFSNYDSLQISAYLINLQNGQSRKVVDYNVSSRSTFNIPGILDPQATVTTTGDTILCFVKMEYDPIIQFYGSRLTILHISTGAITESEVVRTVYSSGQGNLVVEGNRIWWLAGDKLQCLDINTGQTVWQVVNQDYAGSKLLVRQGKILVFDDYTSIQAFDANTGGLLWSQNSELYSGDLGGSFIHNGRLFTVQGGYLVGLDFETGCPIDKHGFLPGAHIELKSMAASADGKTIFLLGYENFAAVPVPQ